jgi:hypothetical protein
MAKARAMKVTTVRFSNDLWATIAREAEIAGVSASQFVREAALARAAASAGARGELPFPSYAATVRQIEAAAPSESSGELKRALTLLTRAMAANIRSDAEALRAQSEHMKRRAEKLLDEPASRRRRTRSGDEPDAEEVPGDGTGSAHQP